MTNSSAANSNVISNDFTQILSDRYVTYAVSTMTGRALPDVRDGLKPVHRRILYAMLALKLNPSSGYKKCARVVGDVIGKYHPHGDAAVYDAMVRLAQNFAVRYPLVDGQGNFGSVDGDNAAAMRYTEARLTPMALGLMENLDRGVVDLRENYDGSEEEPVVFPASFPNLLANGSEGIAVGMATSIPPHNLIELLEASIALINTPDITTDELLNYVQGPDLPTAATIITNREQLKQIYETGRGSLKVRAKWQLIELPRGQYNIAISELPYQVNKSRLVERLAELVNQRELMLLNDIRDESTSDVHIVLEPRSYNLPPEQLMAHLFKVSDLEVNLHFNCNVLDAQGLPRMMGLKTMLQSFIDHRREVLCRELSFRAQEIASRLHLVAGLLVVYLNLDEVIRIIRESDEPKVELIKSFKLDEIQAEAILNLRLRALRKLDELALVTERKALASEQQEIQSVLASDAKQWQRIIKEFGKLISEYSKDTNLHARRTQVIFDAEQIVAKPLALEQLIAKEPVTVWLSQLGWIKAAKGHDFNPESAKLKTGDQLLSIIAAQSTDKLLLISSSGKAFNIDASKLPSGKEAAEPLRLMIDLGHDEKIVAFAPLSSEQTWIFASKAGKALMVQASDLVVSTKTGKQVMRAADGDSLFIAKPVSGSLIATIGENRKMLIFPTYQLPVMKRGQGITLQKYRDGGLSDIYFLNDGDALKWQVKDKEYEVKDLMPWRGDRAQTGRLAPNGFPANNKFVG